MALTKIPANMLSGVDLGDSVRINLGTDNDLALFHTGGNGVIHNTTGELRIRANNLKLQDYTNEDLMIVATSDGSVDLYHNNQKKFETSATGASVTGNLAVSGNLTVSGTTTELDTTNLNVTDKNITLNYHASNDTSSNADGAGLTIQDAVNASTDATLNWSAANDRFVMSHGLQVTSGNVGIGIATPTAMLDVRRGDASGKIAEFHNNSGYGIDIGSSQAVAYISSGYNQRLDFKTDPTSGQTERMSILANGNVGIGIVAPTTALHVSSGDGSAELILQRTGAQASLWGLKPYNADFYIRENSTDRITVKAGGNVGIGTTAPTVPLSIRKVHGNGYGSGIDMLDFKAYYPPNYDTETSKASIFVGTSDKHTLNTHGGYLAFKVNQSGFSGSGSTNLIEAMRIEKDGKVGIGTDNPGEKLDVDGIIQIKRTGDHPAIRFMEGGTTRGYIGSGDWAINGLAQADFGISSVGVLALGTVAGVERLRIDTSGNVGIGTISPYSKLNVQGTSASTYTGSGPGATIRASQGTDGNWIASDVDGKFAYFGVDGNDAKFAAYNYATSTEMGIVLGQSRMYIKNNGNVAIGSTTSPETLLHVKGTNNSAGDLYTQVGPGNVPSITIQNAGTTNNNNAAIYFRDDQDMRGSINMRFVNHSTHASELRFATTQANNTREKFVMTAAGQLGINKMSGFDTGGFGTPMLVIKQAVNSSWGGINVEANGNDSIFSISCLDTGSTLNTSYRTGAGHKPLTMQCAGQDGIQIGTGGNVRIGSGNVASNGATHQLHVDSGTIGYGLKVHSNTGYGLAGSNNGSYFHHSTDRAMYYWDSPGYFSGGAHTYSDSRLKENVVIITGALDSVAKMNGVTFTWINEDKRRGPDGKQFGVLAQNMLEVDSALPTLNVDPLETQDNIDDDSKDTDYYSMDYARLTPYFIEAIKELKTKLEAAEARITTLEG